jgi:hypothetical protein
MSSEKTINLDANRNLIKDKTIVKIRNKYKANFMLLYITKSNGNETKNTKLTFINHL